MKTIFTALVAAFLLSVNYAQASTQEVINSAKKKQIEIERRIVKMWLNNQRGENLDKEIGECLVSEIRIRTLTGDKETGSLLSKVLKDESIQVDNPKAVARLMAQIYLHKRGAKASQEDFVFGEYETVVKVKQ